MKLADIGICQATCFLSVLRTNQFIFFCDQSLQQEQVMLMTSFQLEPPAHIYLVNYLLQVDSHNKV